jgi:hypothetical protein
VTPRLFFGYDLAAAGARRVKIARPEKAVLDFLYLNPRLRSDADFGSLRFDGEMFFQLVSEERLGAALARFRHKALLQRAERFLSYWRERS